MYTVDAAATIGDFPTITAGFPQSHSRTGVRKCSQERSCDVSITKQHTPQSRPVLKCRCGGLYRDPDAHHEAFGHLPDPVYADLGYQPDPMFDPLRYEPINSLAGERHAWEEDHAASHAVPPWGDGH
jgi:hypothetical protein